MKMKRRQLCHRWSWSLRKCEKNSGFRNLVFAVFVGLLVISSGLAKAEPVALVQVASVSGLTPLPDASMAMVTGGRLQLPSLAAVARSRGAVVLWDEIRPPGLLQRVENSGTVTITVNGAVQ
jgi:hypothetical protein